MEKKLLKKVFAGEMTIDEAHDRLRNAFASKSLPPDGLPAKPKKLQVPAASKAEDITSEVTLQAPGVSADSIKSAMAEVLSPLTNFTPLTQLIEKLDKQQELIEKQNSTIEEHQKFIAAQDERWQKVADLTDPISAGFSGLALNPINKNRGGVAKQAEIAERAQQMMVRQLERTWRTSENPAEREAAFTALSKYPGFEE